MTAFELKGELLKLLVKTCRVRSMTLKKTKVCPKCEKRKRVSSFSTAWGRYDSLAVWCKDCSNTYSAGRYQQTKERHKQRTTVARKKRVAAGSTVEREYAASYRQKNRGKIRPELATRRADAVKRCKKKGLPSTITLAELEALWRRQRGRCMLTGWKMQVAQGGLKDPYCLTIDRIDDGLGYVLGNVRLICWMANKAKAAWGPDLFLKMCKAVSRRGRG